MERNEMEQLQADEKTYRRRTHTPEPGATPYRRYTLLLYRLHRLSLEGKDQGPEGEGLCEQMSDLSYGMDPKEMEQLRDLSGDLFESEEELRAYREVVRVMIVALMLHTNLENDPSMLMSLIQQSNTGATLSPKAITVALEALDEATEQARRVYAPLEEK